MFSTLVFAQYIKTISYENDLLALTLSDSGTGNQLSELNPKSVGGEIAQNFYSWHLFSLEVQCLLTV